MQSTLPQNNQHSQKKSRWGSLVFSTILAVLGISIWLNQQYIVDSVHFWQYQPSSEIAEITSKSQLTDSGKFMFYAAQPSIEGKATFSQRCGTNKEQNTAILGCYAANKIYLYDVTDSKLDGIKEVTGAHEMLHVVYARMSDGERRKIDALLETEYAKLQNQSEYAERMAFYARNEPGERDNELHSIIGTEVAMLSPELEEHYSRYFSDRTIITGLYRQYHQAFDDLRQQNELLTKQLSALDEEFKSSLARYRTDVAQLEADIERFNAQAEGGEFTSRAQMNAERADLVSRTEAIDARRDAVNALAAKFNQLIDQYNDTATQTNELNKSIDSSLSPAPKV